MKFSVWPAPGRPTDEILDLARATDALGYFGYWFADHYMPDSGSEDIKTGDIHEVWSLLPAIAAVTESIRVGPLVSPTSVHHPAVLANRAATLDHVSHGRMVLGLGAGWQINEHKAYGIELEPPKERVDRFEEAIQIVRLLLDEDRTTFDGTYYSVADAPSDPSPVQDQLPILVGTSGPRMCRITAQYAQEWNTWGGPDKAAENVKVFNAACEKVGVDPSSKHTSVQALFFFTDDQAAIDGALAGPMGDRSIAGSDDRIVEAIGQYAALGFDEVIVPDFTIGKTPQDRTEAYERFMADIVPQCG
jgi:alkanesulfonate monooxygenase SsuD/methylene tetrahydromethanopterin reductase-like flavin-dependent oxidoreductase (luciferase family)